MNYLTHPQFHFKPASGWMNDPNGLVQFGGYYHIFFQHAPHFEQPGKESVHWGHARTKDFLHWEELPIALYPDMPYDRGGCWSGTALEWRGKLWLAYASIHEEGGRQLVSIAWSEDGVAFHKLEENPVIDHFPADGGPDFRDPALCLVGDTIYCVMASGNPQSRTARLLLYKSSDMVHWDYVGIMSQWEACRYAECPSFMAAGEGDFLLAASVCPLESRHYFTLSYGSFADDRFLPRVTAEVDKGPDQYAGQVFRDEKGRIILMSWIPGWSYVGFAEKDIGCLSVPREIRCQGEEITAWPVEEVQHLLKEEDPCLVRTASGFRVERAGREPLVYEGKIDRLAILRDGYVAEIFVNGGREVFTVIL